MPHSVKEKVGFYFDGRRFEAELGDTIGYALARSGRYTISRSSKLHRRRGIRCGRGYCRSCLVNVDGIPNVPACITKVEDGMVVESQNTLPKASFDILSILDFLPQLVSPKAIYEGLPSKPAIWPIARRIIDRIVGLGEIPRRSGVYTGRGILEVDVAIVGGGISGLSAAATTSRYGLKTLIIESMDSLGGRGRLDPIPDKRLEHLGYSSPKDLVEDLKKKVEEGGVEIVVSADAYGLYVVEGTLAVYVREGFDRGGHLLVKAKNYIIATGGYEEPGHFLNNDMPGVLYDYGFRRMVLDFKIEPPTPIAIVGWGELADRMKALLETLDIEFIGPYYDLECGEDKERIVEAKGRDKVEWVVLEKGGVKSKVRVGLIVLCKRLVPAGELAWHAGIPYEYIDSLECYVPKHNRYMETSNPRVLVAGRVAGARDYLESLITGEIAGLTSTLKILGEREDILSLREDRLRVVGEVGVAK